MYVMYVYYAWHVYYHVYVYCSSVHPSIHVCFVRILCMCAGYVSVYVYYICLSYIPCTCIPSKCVHPSIHPYVLCVYTIYVYYVCIQVLLGIFMLCMQMVYVQYVWFEYCCIHLSVRPSIRPCMCPLSLKRCIQCMYNMYVPRYYTIHVYYVHTPCMVFILYIHPSV